MRAAVYYGDRDVRVAEVPTPQVGPGEILIAVRACGICGTDISKVVNDKVPAGTVLGHEVAGDVLEVGKGVEGFKPGDRVFAAHHVPCFTCRMCRHDHHTLCEQFVSEMNIDPGGFAEKLRVLRPSVEKSTVVIPDDMPYEEACLIEPLACVLRAQQKCGIQPGDVVAVVGVGPIGLLHVQLARVMGAGTVIAIDVNTERLELAKKLGAAMALNATQTGMEKAVREASDGLGADLVINTVGIADVYENAVGYLRDGGILCFFAECPPGSRMTFDPDKIAGREISFVGSYSSTPAEIPAALKLLHDKRIDVHSLITHRLGLEDVAEAVELATSGKALKIIIQP